MKNFLMMMFVCAGMCFTFHSPALAGGGGNSGSNGKVSSRARFVIDNNTEEDLLIWIRPQGTPLPATVAELNDMLIAVTPNRQNRDTSRLRNGTFTLTLFFAEDVADFIDADLDQELFEDGTVSQTTAVLNGEDIDVEINEEPVPGSSFTIPTLSLP